MPASTTISRRIAVLIVLQLQALTPSQADNSEIPLIKEEAAKQSAIYQSQGEDVPSGYYINRSLLSYTMNLSPEFKRSLAALGPADRWLDIGAGEGRAVLDYCTAKYDVMFGAPDQPSAKKAQAVAMSIEDRRTAEWHQTAANVENNQIRYLFGRRFGEYSPEELGRFRVITDVLGGFSYTENLARFTAKALALLETNGDFYTLLQDVHAEDGSNKPHYPDSPYLTEIVDAGGKEVRVCSWLKSIGCAEVSCELRMNFTPPVEVYRIRKVCNDVTVPGLALVHFTSGTPPERRFQVQGSAVQPGEIAR
jgi:hypothetical protein